MGRPVRFAKLPEMSSAKDTGDRQDIDDAALAVEVVDRLRARGDRLVLAESCTSGLLAANLGGVAGVSETFCGSAVTYRDATKQAWLDIPSDVIRRHTSVSAMVTRQMATQILEKTAEADLSLAVTGHLGPLAPESIDGVVFFCIGFRRVNRGEVAVVGEQQIKLIDDDRSARQQEAASRAWRFLLSRMSDLPPATSGRA